MRWIVFVLVACWIQSALAMPTVMGIVYICINKPGTKLKEPPGAWIERERNAIGVDELSISAGKVPSVFLRKRPRRAVTRISATADLRPWFKNRDCIKSWETFHSCLNREVNPEDERFYRDLDRKFYARIICQNGCENDDFLKWRIRWPSPALVTLEADIGKPGGFTSLEAARTSLAQINALLKKVVYGARFPEDFGEAKTDLEAFAINKSMILDNDFRDKISRLLADLTAAGYLVGLDASEISTISALAGNSNIVFYVPASCPSRHKPGWNSEPNNVRIGFDRDGCPRLQVLR